MDVQRLAKVLALAGSDNDAEALHALRTAGRLLDGAGLDFVALASRLAEGGPVVSATRLEDLEDTVFDLRNEVRHLRAENEKLRRGVVPSATASLDPGLANAAQDAAQLIRLGAELADAKDTVAAEKRRADGAEREARVLQDDLAQAIAVAETLAGQAEALKGRCDRLEAENRRLGLMASALKGELDERLADRTHPLPPAPPAEPAAAPSPVTMAEPAPRRPTASAQPPANTRRAKAKAAAQAGGQPANQYALF